MANQKHLGTVRQGVKAWNRWRQSHRGANIDLRGADLEALDLRHANLHEADLRYSNLKKAELSHADLVESRLDFADLSDATLHAAQLYGATLIETNLFRTNLIGADFTFASLDRADLTEALLCLTVFAKNDLSQAKGLETIEHVCASTIDIETIYKSKGNFPRDFLRGAGVPEVFIEYMKSLTTSAIEFYSCFLSYSTKDQLFIERLYSDLQNKGVRCWFAPQDLRIGDKFRQRIDESIKVHDKLLLVLSADSISSSWVEDEVENALERERLEQRLVLFPIRIDDCIFDSNRAWAASLRRQRLIGDFSNWKDYDSYEMAFAALLRDLKTKHTPEKRIIRT